MFTAFLLVFAGMLVIVSGNRCKRTEIELYDPSDSSKFTCWPAPDCQEGQELTVKPGSTHPKGTSVHCVSCPDGSFSNIQTSKTCHKCTVCGNKEVLLTCTLVRDRLCSNSCIPGHFYFNATDQQCYPCTECCGANNASIEPQCVLLSLRIGAVIGGKGSLHCKVLPLQRCDELPKEIVEADSNDRSALGKNCTCNWSIRNIVSSDSNISSAATKNCSMSDNNLSSGSENYSLHVGLIWALVSMAVLILVLLWLLIRKKRQTSSRCCLPLSQSCPGIFSWFSGSLTSAGRGRAHEMTPCISPFLEKLKLIPDGLKIDSIPYEVEELIKKLDGKKPHSKNWWHVGRKLGVSNEELEVVKREDDREGGSPTTILLSTLRTWDDVVTLTKFVEVLLHLKRHDIANPIIDFYKPQASHSGSNV